MNRKRRKLINTKTHPIRYKASKWLKQHKDVAFNIPLLTEELGLNPVSRYDTNFVYRNVILYWRKKFIPFYYSHKKAGFLDGYDRNTAWDVLLWNYNQNDAYVFLYDHTLKYFVQPSFDELEKMDKKRLENQWKGINTVINEMEVMDAYLLINGIQKPIHCLLDAGVEVDRLLTKRKDE